MLIRNYSETRPHALSRPGEYVYRLSQYGMYKVTQSSQQSLPSYSSSAEQVTACSLSLLHLGPPRSMPCCNAASVISCHTHRAEAWNSLPRMTKVSNRPIIIALTVDALLYSVHVSCTFHALYWKWSPKVGGTNTLLVPPNQKVGGTCLPRSPWLLRLWLHQ